MSEKVWSDVDGYIASHLVPSDPSLDQALATARAAGLPEIQVTATQGKLLHMLARLVGARRIVEVGTLGGYSTIWMARALAPGGRVITIEMDAQHAAVARANFARAEVADRVDLREGRAADVLPKIAADGGPSFDLSFIDADKAGNPDYFDWALRMSRSGSVIVVDNVVRDGSVLDAGSDDASVQGTRRLFERVAAERRVTATAIQTVGGKGYDGFLIAQVLG